MSEELIITELFDRWERVWHEGQYDLIPDCVVAAYAQHDEAGDRSVTREDYAAKIARTHQARPHLPFVVYDHSFESTFIVPAGLFHFQPEEEHMSTRNTPVLREIIEVLFTELDEQATALSRLEHHFHDRLLADVGDINTVGTYAEELRLRITEGECFTVLDYIAQQKMVVVTIDVVETAINELLGWDRFMEP